MQTQSKRVSLGNVYIDPKMYSTGKMLFTVRYKIWKQFYQRMANRRKLTKTKSKNTQQVSINNKRRTKSDLTQHPWDEH